jgi:hypothetical protein
MKKRLALVAVVLLEANSYAANYAWLTNDASLGAFASTMGIGLEYQKRISDTLAVKFGISGFSYNKDTTVDDVDYEADLKLRGLGLTLDYHPFSSGLYVSGGVYYNGNKFEFTATPHSGTYTFNGHTYNVKDVGSVEGESDLNKFAPFIGLGYDASVFKEGSLFFSLKIGALYQGKPKVNLTAICGPTIADTQQCTNLQKDVEVEEANLNDDIKDYKWWPILSIGIMYQF